MMRKRRCIGRFVWSVGSVGCSDPRPGFPRIGLAARPNARARAMDDQQHTRSVDGAQPGDDPASGSKRPMTFGGKRRSEDETMDETGLRAKETERRAKMEMDAEVQRMNEEGISRKGDGKMKCSRCGLIGHSNASSLCPGAALRSHEKEKAREEEWKRTAVGSGIITQPDPRSLKLTVNMSLLHSSVTPLTLCIKRPNEELEEHEKLREKKAAKAKAAKKAAM